MFIPPIFAPIFELPGRLAPQSTKQGALPGMVPGKLAKAVEHSAIENAGTVPGAQASKVSPLMRADRTFV